MLTTAVLTVAALVGLAAPASAVATGTITGTVWDDGGEPAADVHVAAYAAGHSAPAAEVTTDDDGEYDLAGLEPGIYTVSFESWAEEPTLVPEWWDDAPARAAATPITVTAGVTTADISPYLSTSAAIEGRVSDANDDPLADVRVTAVPQMPGYESWQRETTTDAAGNYRIDGLGPGEYKVRFEATDESPSVLAEWWSDAGDSDEATTIDAFSGSVISGVDAQLTRAAAFSGVVTTADGTPVSGVDVEAYSYDPLDDIWQYTASVATDVDGAYRIGGLVAGDYKVHFDATYADTAVASQWWDAALTRGAATLVNVEAGKTNTTVSPVLAAAGRVSGVVSVRGVPAAGVTVTAYAYDAESAAWDELAETTSGTAGAYAIAGLAPGTYRIGFDASATAYAVDAEWWKDAATIAAANDVVVTAGGTVSGISGELGQLATLKSATPTISGTVAYGSTVTAKPGTWTSGTTFAYQWYASGKAISGATKSTFTLASAQKAKTITVKVTGKKSGYTTVSKTSKATAKVATVATPKISGTAKVGKKLTAKPGTWTSGTKFTYQWYAGGKAISKATKSTFTLTRSQKGKTITVKVTGKKSGYATVAKTSRATGKVK
ncbi:hypothetical protein GCM10025738_27720 [Microbacterium fluvii]